MKTALDRKGLNSLIFDSGEFSMHGDPQSPDVSGNVTIQLLNKEGLVGMGKFTVAFAALSPETVDKFLEFYAMVEDDVFKIIFDGESDIEEEKAEAAVGAPLNKLRR